jgi:aspartate/methionine/tyrosine aminotransferase
MTVRFDAPFVRWATLRAPARFDLAGSAIAGCTIDDLEGAREAIELTGDNSEGYGPLIESITARYGVPESGVTTAQGASGANFLVCAALLEHGDDVLVERPGYDALLGTAQFLGARTVRFDRNFSDGFAVDPDRVRHAITTRTRLIVLTSPQNPTGVVVDRAALEEVGRIASARDAHVLVDEVYLDAARSRSDAETSTIETVVALGDVFISTSSLTKSYGLSGLRCGWILSSPGVAERVRHVRRTMDASGSIVTARLAALAFSQINRLSSRAREILHANQPLVRAFLRSRPELEWVQPEGGTVVFPRIQGIEDSTRFVERLLAERETAVVPGHFFDAPAHFRLGFGGPTATLRLGLEAISAALDSREW